MSNALLYFKFFLGGIIGAILTHQSSQKVYAVKKSSENKGEKENKKNKKEDKGEENRKDNGDDASEDAKSFIQDIGRQVIDLLSKGKKEGKIQEFQKIFDKYFHVSGMARRVLGRKLWKAASTEQKTDYVEKFREDMVKTYVNLFERYYADQTLEILKAESKKKNVRVYSQIISKGKKIPVLWRLKEVEGVLKITDVLVEGASITRSKSYDYQELGKKGMKELLSALDKKNKG